MLLYGQSKTSFTSTILLVVQFGGMSLVIVQARVGFRLALVCCRRYQSAMMVRPSGVLPTRTRSSNQLFLRVRPAPEHPMFMSCQKISFAKPDSVASSGLVDVVSANKSRPTRFRKSTGISDGVPILQMSTPR